MGRRKTLDQWKLTFKISRFLVMGLLICILNVYFVRNISHLMANVSLAVNCSAC